MECSPSSACWWASVATDPSLEFELSVCGAISCGRYGLSSVCRFTMNSSSNFDYANMGVWGDDVELQRVDGGFETVLTGGDIKYGCPGGHYSSRVRFECGQNATKVQHVTPREMNSISLFSCPTPFYSTG